ncbi:hypothetical protein B4144_1868 [Bacillus atrophaeus]|nr:hypothetical protein B4144_1868 [Bacillus atrophaeus]
MVMANNQEYKKLFIQKNMTFGQFLRNRRFRKSLLFFCLFVI